MDLRLKKWIRWLAVIKADVQQLLINQNIFWEIQELIRANERIQKPSSFYKYLGDTYVSYATIGIRRQLKIDQSSISFSRLFADIAENPKTLSREYYKSLFKGSVVEDLADRQFDRYSEHGRYISAAMVRNDLAKLKSVSKKVEDFVDKRIAHHDRRKPKVLPKFHEVDTCIATLDELYVKYHLIFHAESMHTLMPTYQYDWKVIFSEPWLVPETEENEI